MDKNSFLVAKKKQNNNTSFEEEVSVNKQNFRRKERLLQHSLRGFDTKKKRSKKKTKKK